MENIARAFDLPFNSREHLALAETAWMGGTLVSVRFYLGRLLCRNLFRESDCEVEERLVGYISSQTSAAGGELVRGTQGWAIAGEILRYRFELQSKGLSELKSTNILAIEAFLANPSVAIGTLAENMNTTEKQLAKISGLTLARRQSELMRIRHS